MEIDVKSRSEQWVKASYSTSKFEEDFFIVVVQQLARLDIELIKADLRLSPYKHIPSEPSLEYDKKFTLSYLWVLGAYEVIRAMCQRIEENKCSFSKETREKFQKVKREYNRLRVPLAKMEPSNSHSKTDSPIAWPCEHRDFGTSWQLNAETYISRFELSELLLGLLEEFRSQQLDN